MSEELFSTPDFANISSSESEEEDNGDYSDFGINPYQFEPEREQNNDHQRMQVDDQIFEETRIGNSDW